MLRHPSHSELTRVRCILFLLLEFNQVLVYNKTIFKLTILSFYTFQLKRVCRQKSRKGKIGQIVIESHSSKRYLGQNP